MSARSGHTSYLSGSWLESRFTGYELEKVTKPTSTVPLNVAYLTDDETGHQFKGYVLNGVLFALFCRSLNDKKIDIKLNRYLEKETTVVILDEMRAQEEFSIKADSVIVLNNIVARNISIVAEKKCIDPGRFLCAHDRCDVQASSYIQGTHTHNPDYASVIRSKILEGVRHCDGPKIVLSLLEIARLCNALMNSKEDAAPSTSDFRFLNIPTTRV
jgi:hypothetical protein